MAHKCYFRTPWNGMSHIWNIDDKVGTQISERNNPDDVLLTKILFDIILTAGGGASAYAGCKVKPVVNSMMDQSLGFWIYFSQVESTQGKAFVDGFISPLRGHPNMAMAICRLNFGAYSGNKTAWENMPNHPSCSSSLKQSLLAPPKTY